MLALDNPPTKHEKVIRAASIGLSILLHLSRTMSAVLLFVPLCFLYLLATRHTESVFSMPALGLVLLSGVFLWLNASKLLDCNRALRFAAWLRDRERFKADIAGLTAALSRTTGLSEQSKQGLMDQFAALVDPENFSLSAFKQAAKQARKGRARISDIQDKLGEYQEVVAGGMAVPGALAPSFLVFSPLITAGIVLCYLAL